MAGPWIYLFQIQDSVPSLLLVLKLQMLYVDSLLKLLSFPDRWLYKVLSRTKFADSTCFLEFSLESLESPLDVLTFLKWYNNHI